MTKFETRASEFLVSCETLAQANRTFSNSCNICCKTGRRCDCDRCIVAETHSLVIAIIADNNKKKKMVGA